MKARTLLFFISFLFFYQANNAQILDKIKKVKNTVAKTISLDKLKQDPVTTSFNDVDKTKYLEDDFGNDAVYKNIHDQPYSWENGFFLAPGFYEGYFNSFCIKAGTYAPQRGDGRFYAELKGPKADIIEAIIEGYQKNPDITQEEVQLLLWAIIAKTDFQKMRGEIKVTALKLLTPDQIARLSKGALEKYATNEIKKIAKKDKTLAAMLEAENNLRQKYYEGVSDYNEYEAIAMRAGIDPVSYDYNRGRWTKHPNGFFIRYRIKSYKTTITQIYVPEDAIEAYQPIKGNGPSTNDFCVPIVGKFYKSRNSIATPSSPAAQRIIQTDIEPGSTGGPGTGGPGGNNTESGEEDTNDDTSSGGSNDDEGTSGGNNQGDDGNDGNGNSGGNNSGGVLPTGEEETNAFECEEVVNPIADATIKRELLFQNLPGALICVFKGDSIIHMKAYGEMAPGKNLTLDTKLHWASISKSVTAVAAIQMVERGKLKLSDKPSNVLSYWPSSIEVRDEDNKKLTENRLGNITLKQLLNNTSGIQHYGKGMNDSTFTIFKNKKVPFIENKNYNSLPNGEFNAESAVSTFNKSVLDFEPGMSYNYSSYGFVLAGAMVDEKSEYGFEDWINKNIKRQLGLKSFQKNTNTDTYGYEMYKDGIVGWHKVGTRNSVLPAGGWESTICDLATYARALSKDELFIYNDNPLWKESNVYKPMNYGLGVIRTGTGNNLRVAHDGTNKYVRSLIQFFPSDHTGVAILVPQTHADVWRIAKNLINDMSLRVGLYPSNGLPLDSCHKGMDSKSDKFLGVWRKTRKKQIIRTGLELEAFKIEMNKLSASGYHLDTFDISYVGEDSKEIYDGVFKEGVKNQVLISTNTQSKMDDAVRNFRSQGLEIVDVNYGKIKNEEDEDGIYNVSYNALFEKNAPQSTLVYANTVDIEDVISQQQSNNLKIVDIESIPILNSYQQNFVCLFIPGSPNEFLIEDASVFKDNFKNGSYNAKGEILDIELYKLDRLGNTFWKLASIWEHSGKNQRNNLDDDKNQYSFCDFMELHSVNAKDGFELIDWERL